MQYSVDDTADIQDNAITLAKMAGGTDGNLITYDASGDPAYVATGSDGQVLTSTGAGSPPAFEALPSGRITDYSVFLLTSSVGLTGDSSFADITANQAESGQPSYSRIGSAMTVSSGVFTFPSTGYWLVTGHFNAGGSQGYARAQLMATTNNSSYAEVMVAQDESGSNSEYGYLQVFGLIDVTNTTNVKVKFRQGGTAGRFDGGTSPPSSQFTFARIGDT